MCHLQDEVISLQIVRMERENRLHLDRQENDVQIVGEVVCEDLDLLGYWVQVN